MSQLDHLPITQRHGATGWGYTRGWSKRIHRFEDGRAICNGSQPRPGEALRAKLIPGDVACRDCCRKHYAHLNRLRGSGRPARYGPRLHYAFKLLRA